MPKIDLSEKTMQALSTVAGDCLYDMDARGARSRRVMAEVALDADRLRTWGFPEAHAEVSAQIEKHGYPAVERAVMKFIPTACLALAIALAAMLAPGEASAHPQEGGHCHPTQQGKARCH